LDKIIDQIKRSIGSAELRKLAFILSGPHNNWQVARDFDIPVFYIGVINDNIHTLCHTILEENEHEKIYYPIIDNSSNNDSSAKSDLRSIKLL
jgi:hypothetical protein